MEETEEKKDRRIEGAECVLGIGASERAYRAGWSSRLEPIEEVLARFAHVEFGKLPHRKRDSACVCMWMVEALSFPGSTRDGAILLASARAGRSSPTPD